MQLSYTAPEQNSPQNSQDSVIPEDWIIELQRLVQRLTLACPTDHPEEALFTVYTWYLDHSAELSCGTPKLATLRATPMNGKKTSDSLGGIESIVGNMYSSMLFFQHIPN